MLHTAAYFLRVLLLRFYATQGAVSLMREIFSDTGFIS